LLVGQISGVLRDAFAVLMAYPNARLLRLTKYGIEPVTVEQTDHFRSCWSFATAGFVECG